MLCPHRMNPSGLLQSKRPKPSGPTTIVLGWHGGVVVSTVTSQIERHGFESTGRPGAFLYLGVLWLSSTIQRLGLGLEG